MPNFFILTYTGFGILALLIIILIIQVFRMRRKFNRFFKNGDENLEQLLNSQLKQTEDNQENIEKILERVKALEENSKKTFQKTGLVRFNPFKETGSNQSFSVALLTKENNGFVITSLYGREENRVYAKPINKGKSEFSLSDEEKEAIEKAKKSN